MLEREVLGGDVIRASGYCVFLFTGMYDGVASYADKCVRQYKVQHFNIENKTFQHGVEKSHKPHACLA